jgi:hypothetical protein
MIRCLSNQKDFEVHIQLISHALKTHNKELLEDLREVFKNLISCEYFIEVMQAAVPQLAETDSDTYDWTVQNFHDYI